MDEILYRAEHAALGQTTQLTELPGGMAQEGRFDMLMAAGCATARSTSPDGQG